MFLFTDFTTHTNHEGKPPQYARALLVNAWK